LSGWPPLDLVTILIFLSADNVIANIRIWTDSLHDSSGKLSHLSNKKKRIGAFGLLELEIWAEHWTVSGLQDRFWLLCCCYNLNLKTVLLNLWLFMKVLRLCLSFLSIQTIPKSKLYSSSYDPITEWCSNLNSTSISFLSLALSLSSQFQ
jgi:hypothetical protein